MTILHIANLHLKLFSNELNQAKNCKFQLGKTYHSITNQNRTAFIMKDSCLGSLSCGRHQASGRLSLDADNASVIVRVVVDYHTSFLGAGVEGRTDHLPWNCSVPLEAVNMFIAAGVLAIHGKHGSHWNKTSVSLLRGGLKICFSGYVTDSRSIFFLRSRNRTFLNGTKKELLS